MRWINKAQQERDHAGLREVCGACGHSATSADPLTITKDGSRVHTRHVTDPRSGLYGQGQ